MVMLMMIIITITSGQSNLTKRPHPRRKWTIVPILYHVPFLPPQNRPFPCGDLDPHVKRGCCRFIKVHNQNDMSKGSNGFCKAHYCDRPTGHAIPSVTIGRIYVVLRCGLIIIIIIIIIITTTT